MTALVTRFRRSVPQVTKNIENKLLKSQVVLVSSGPYLSDGISLNLVGPHAASKEKVQQEAKYHFMLIKVG